MDQLERALLNYLGEQEYTHWDNIVDFFNATGHYDISRALLFLIDQGYAQEVKLQFNLYYQRTVKGGIESRGYTVTDDSDIPF